MRLRPAELHGPKVSRKSHSPKAARGLKSGQRWNPSASCGGDLMPASHQIEVNRLCSSSWPRGYVPVDGIGNGLYQALDLMMVLDGCQVRCNPIAS